MNRWAKILVLKIDEDFFCSENIDRNLIIQIIFFLDCCKSFLDRVDAFGIWK